MEHKITEEMIPRDHDIVSDVIRQEGGCLVGRAYHYIFSDKQLKLRQIEFNIRIGFALSSFKYKKPVIGAAGVLNPIDERVEENPCEGYVPLVIVRNAYRGPHHWHREDDGLFCAARKKGNEWEIRYFPRQNIPTSTWMEACAMLGKKPA